MKKLLAIFLLPLALFGAAGDIKISYKSSNDISWIDAIFAKQNSMILGTTSAGVPAIATAGTLNLNAVALPAGLSGTQLQLGQVDGTNTRLTLDGFGAATIIDGRRSAGTNASKSPLLSGAIMLRIGGLGYGASYSTSERAFINFTASENWSNTLQGSIVEIGTTPIGSTTTSVSQTFSATGLAFNTVAQRITGDFSNATIASRVMFQTTTADTATAMGVIPNGSSTTAQMNVINNSTPTNGGVLKQAITSSVAILNSSHFGSGTTLPLQLQIDDVAKFTIGTDGNVVMSGTVSVGGSTPASASAAGVAGTITWDASFIYVCTATNTWRRAAISSW